MPPWSTKLRTLSRQVARETERDGPRVVGMMQKEQRLPQPSCTLRLGRVWAESGAKGRVASSEWAKARRGGFSVRAMIAEEMQVHSTRG